MLYYVKIGISEEIGINKISASKEWYLSLLIFLDKGFKFQPFVCSRCHYILMISIDLNNIAILNICGVGYRCIINGIRKRDAVNLLQNADLSEGKGVL